MHTTDIALVGLNSYFLPFRCC